MIENGIDIKNVITITVDYALDEYIVNEDIEKIWQLKEELFYEYLFGMEDYNFMFGPQKMKLNFINKIKEKLILWRVYY